VRACVRTYVIKDLCNQTMKALLGDSSQLNEDDRESTAVLM